MARQMAVATIVAELVFGGSITIRGQSATSVLSAKTPRYYVLDAGFVLPSY
jgi:hypothetical protein